MDETDMDKGFGRPDMDAERMPGGTIEHIEGTAKRVVLAGIGAAAEAYEVAEDTFDRLVERGSQVENEWQDRAMDMRRQNAGARWRVQEYLRGAMGSFLDSLNIPSKTDVDTINVKLNILARKLDDLQMEQVQSGGAPGQPDIDPTAPPSPPSDNLTT